MSFANSFIWGACHLLLLALSHSHTISVSETTTAGHARPTHSIRANSSSIASLSRHKLCQVQILRYYSRKGGKTTSLKNHLKSIHQNEYEEFLKSESDLKLKNTASQSSTASSSTPLQEARKQLTLKDSLMKNQKWCTSNPKSKEIDKLIAEMIALQDLPFNFVEGIGFKRLMQFIAPNYQLRGRQFFTNYICDDLYPKLAEKISQLLKTFDKISFTTDIWSEPSANVSLLSLTAHGINEDFNRIKVILKCLTFDGRHTGDLIQDKFNEMLTEWGIIYEKIHCFIRDGGSNMVRAMRLADIPDITCNVHQLQICVRHMLDYDEDVKSLIGKCKKICTHFNHSQIAQSELHKIQSEQLNQQPLCLLQECNTRWSSTFYMIERMIHIQDSLCLYASKHNIPQISPQEWQQLKKLITLLQPFEEITRNEWQQY
ncbi:Zinc finger BED domain-containing protein 4 [Eumeta japonica]|uniref:Zinc finger BED domain-containing protein 4 n=1 Tax=Eumeta variegata TaxID=151549 RepID=A0A4C1VWE8_EUMVA|nr:Zinc finger BED domain-containing protein 4 [Eumeta japonica]